MAAKRWNQIFAAAAFNLPKLAERSGLSLDTLRSISSGRSAPRAESRLRVAGALREQARILSTLADEIDPDRNMVVAPGGPEAWKP